MSNPSQMEVCNFTWKVPTYNSSNKRKHTHLPKSPNIPIIHYPFQNLLVKKEKEYTTTYNDTHLWVAKISNEINLPEFHVYISSTNTLVFIPKLPDPPQKIEFTAPRSYQPPQGKSAWGPLEKWEEFIEVLLGFAKRMNATKPSLQFVVRKPIIKIRHDHNDHTISTWISFL